MKGYMNKVVKIDLSTQTVEEYPISDKYRKLYVGGKIMAARILYDMLPEKIDAFSESAPIVIMTSPLTGSGAPCSSRFDTSGVSPLTNYVTSSNCGGNFGIHLKKAGYDGIIIVGKSDKPVYLDIFDDVITFNDASTLWGKTTGETQSLLEPKTNAGKFVIGPAGENLVKYAAIVSEERCAGRNGLGAVFGSKNLKGIVSHGTHMIEYEKKDKFKALNLKWTTYLRSHPLTGKQLPTYGTAGLVTTMNYRGLLSTNNYRSGSYEHFEDISGETLREKYLVKNKGCVTCPIQCGRVVTVDGKICKGPEVETLTLFGSNLLFHDMQTILDANHYCDEYGIDTITLGSSIGFAMELNEKGLWDNGLKFNDDKLDLVDLVKKTSLREGIGNDLAEGTKRMSEKFGGKDYAINVKGLELAAYEPRAAQGMGLGYATANRGGCHLNGGYLVVLEGLGLHVDGGTTKGKAAFAIFFQDLMEAISGAGSCLFTSYSVLPGFLIDKPNGAMSNIVTTVAPHIGGLVAFMHKYSGMLALNLKGLIPYPVAINYLTGMKLTLGDFIKVGERGVNLERMINVRFGLTGEDDTLPKRLLSEKQPENGKVVELAKMKKKYYSYRRWVDGVPTEKCLKRLKI